MAKLELSINSDYVKGWGTWEGVREIMQNALDAQDDGHPMTVRHNGKDVLRVVSEGVKLDPNVWLLGTSSKLSGNYRGCFGEGLNLSMLALVRAGHNVKIINNDESWTPKIEKSEVYGGANVLTIYTRSRGTLTGAFTIEIKGITKATWAMLKPRFTHLAKPRNVIKTTRGDVILDKSFKGKIFVKGIYVQTKADLSAGYDFNNVQTDRDRKMVDDWDLHNAAARAWEEAVTKVPTPKITKRVIKMLEDGAPDVKSMGSQYGTVDTDVAKMVSAHFRNEYGESAVPVTSMAESREVEHLGKRGVVVPAPLAKILEFDVGSVAKAREAHRQSTSKTYSWNDLNNEEKEVYEAVFTVVDPAAASLNYMPIGERLTVVDFNDDSVAGQHRGTGEILIAKKILTCFEELMATVVHEIAHDRGDDGQVDHERAEGYLFSRIIKQMGTVGLVLKVLTEDEAKD